MAAHVPHKDDLSRYYELDLMDTYYNWNGLLNAIDTVNSVENIAGAHIAKQEH